MKIPIYTVEANPAEKATAVTRRMRSLITVIRIAPKRAPRTVIPMTSAPTRLTGILSDDIAKDGSKEISEDVLEDVSEEVTEEASELVSE